MINQYKYSVKMWMGILCITWMLLLPGCNNNANESTATVKTQVDKSFITCFGTIKWRDSHVLSFPFDITIKEINARSGQVLVAQDVLFNVDYGQLIKRKTEFISKLESLHFMKSSYENELEDATGSLSEKLSDLNKRIGSLSISAPFSGKVLNVNTKVGNVVSSGQKLGVLVDDVRMHLTLYFSYAYEKEIKEGMNAEVSIPKVMSSVEAKVEKVEKLRKISADGSLLFEVRFIMDNPGALTKDMEASATIISDTGEKIVSAESGVLEYYQEIDITTEQNGTVVDLPMCNYYEFSEGSLLVRLKNDDYNDQISKLNDQIEKANLHAEELNKGYTFETKAQMDAKWAMLKSLDIDILKAEEKVDMLNKLLSNQEYENTFLEENGSLHMSKDRYLLDCIYAVPNSVAEANEPIMSFAHMDSLEVSCFVEEQLVRDIHTGDKAQLALYSDSTAIELGTVAFISQKAIILNGETVVEVIIKYEGSNFLPGYNVVAKITPNKLN